MTHIAYFVWDHSPGMFNFHIPLLNRPLLWYGFLFALGFYVGYLVLTYLLRRYFLLNPEFRKEDVLSWPDLIKALSTGRGPVSKKIFSKLSVPMQKWCEEWEFDKGVSEEGKNGILAAMNRVLYEHEVEFQIPLSPFSERLCSFASRKWGMEDLLKAFKLLQMEEELKSCLITLKHRAARKAEQLTFYVIIGAIVGARLGDVLFYQSWSELVRDPLSIIAVWQGGLASHGGAVGILVALWVFAKRRRTSFWTAVDFTVIPTAIAAVFIRIGNFFNQEVLGTATNLPWGVVFLHASDGGSNYPRHPAQLYEALWYLIVFGLLLWYWHRHLPFKHAGRLTGLFLILVFGFRFLIEFIKVEQSAHLTPSAMLTMGQWLSLPFIALGLWLMFRKKLCQERQLQNSG